MIGFFTVITFFNILFERKSVTNKVKKKRKSKNATKKYNFIKNYISARKQSPEVGNGE